MDACEAKNEIRSTFVIAMVCLGAIAYGNSHLASHPNACSVVPYCIMLNLLVPFGLFLVLGMILWGEIKRNREVRESFGIAAFVAAATAIGASYHLNVSLVCSV